MTTAKAAKRGRGRPKGSKNKPAAQDDEFLGATPSEEQQSEETETLDNPSLFEEENQVRIPKLEKKGRLYLAQKDLVKRETEKRDGLDEECQLIMADHGIDRYKIPGLKLWLKRGKTHVEGETD